MKHDLTTRQTEVLRTVTQATWLGRWFRAEHPGQRVTLASLYRLGFLQRRAWRGVEGAADAAHEYRVVR